MCVCVCVYQPGDQTHLICCTRTANLCLAPTSEPVSGLLAIIRLSALKKTALQDQLAPEQASNIWGRFQITAECQSSEGPVCIYLLHGSTEDAVALVDGDLDGTQEAHQELLCPAFFLGWRRTRRLERTSKKVPSSRVRPLLPGLGSLATSTV